MKERSPEKNIPQRENNTILYPKNPEILNDYFNVVVFDAFLPLIYEMKGKIGRQKIKLLQQKLATIFSEAVLNPPGDSEMREKIRDICSEFGCSEISTEFIVETLSIYVKDVRSLFINRDGASLSSILYRHIILSFFNRRIFAGLATHILYHFGFSFAEVNEIRVEILEFLGKLIDKRRTLADLSVFMEVLMNRYCVPIYIGKLISAFTIGYWKIISEKYHKDRALLLEMKKYLNGYLPVYSDLQLLGERRKRIIIEWIGSVLEPFLREFGYMGYSETVISFMQTKIMDLFDKLLCKEITPELFSGEIEQLRSDVDNGGDTARILENIGEKNMFISEDSNGKKKNGRGQFGFGKNLTFIDLFFNCIIGLAVYLDNELSEPERLDSFIESIRKSETFLDENIYI